MKQITIVGNLGSNAVRRVASDGRELMSFNVAVNSGKDSVTWFNCIGTLREKMLDYLVKGQAVIVVGDLVASVFKDRVDLQININSCELVGRAPESETTTANK